MKRTLAIIFVIFFVSCAPIVKPAPTETMIPTATITPIPPTTTNTPTSTPKPTKTPIPIIYVTLGSPFAADCGDGIPIIRANASFNGIDKPECADPEHGHSDVWVPNGCNVNSYDGEVIAPAEGNLVAHTGYSTFWLPENVFPVGIESALEFAGVKNLDITKIESVRLELGHIEPIRTGHFSQGESIGNIIPINPSGHRIQTMLAYWVGVVYNGKGYALSPSLFLPSDIKWLCADGITLAGQCEPISNNYPSSCQ